MKVKAWVKLYNPTGESFICSDEIDVPDDCTDEDGVLLEDDVAEYVEEWLQDYFSYGAKLLD